MKAAFTVAGLVGARGLTQLVFQNVLQNPGANTGVMGYGANIVSSFALGWLAKKFKGPEAGMWVTIGGLAGVVARAVQEYSPVGQYVKAQLSGLGDLGIYLPTTFSVPLVPQDTQTLIGGSSMTNPWPQLPAARQGVSGLRDVGSGVGSRYTTAGRYN